MQLTLLLDARCALVLFNPIAIWYCLRVSSSKIWMLLPFGLYYSSIGSICNKLLSVISSVNPKFSVVKSGEWVLFTFCQYVTEVYLGVLSILRWQTVFNIILLIMHIILSLDVLNCLGDIFFSSASLLFSFVMFSMNFYSVQVCYHMPKPFSYRF